MPKGDAREENSRLDKLIAFKLFFYFFGYSLIDDVFLFARNRLRKIYHVLIRKSRDPYRDAWKTFEWYEGNFP